MAKMIKNAKQHEEVYEINSRLAASLLERFDVIWHLLDAAPQVSQTKEPFPDTLRILGKPRCGTTCILGAAANGFCHGEGQVDLCYDESLPSVEAVKAAWNVIQPTSAKLVCIENADTASVCELIELLQRLGCNDIGTTVTNEPSVLERLPLLLNAGLTRMNLSVHRFADEDRQLLESIISMIPQSKQRRIKINRVLMSSTMDDLKIMLKWGLDCGQHIRLFSLMRTPSASDAFDREYVHWTSVAGLFSDRLESVYVTDYVVSNRLRYEFVYSGGGIIETNMPTVTMPDRLVVIPECRSCKMHGLCEEGYLGCGVRLAPDGKFYPCLLRPELSFTIGKDI